MTQDKYIIAKIADAQAVLSVQEQQTLMGILQKIHSGRSAQNKKTHRYVVLNTADVHARAALDAYVQSAAESDNDGVKRIANKMRDILQASRLQDPEKVPD